MLRTLRALHYFYTLSRYTILTSAAAHLLSESFHSQLACVCVCPDDRRCLS